MLWQSVSASESWNADQMHLFKAAQIGFDLSRTLCCCYCSSRIIATLVIQSNGPSHLCCSWVGLTGAFVSTMSFFCCLSNNVNLYQIAVIVDHLFTLFLCPRLALAFWRTYFANGSLFCSHLQLITRGHFVSSLNWIGNAQSSFCVWITFRFNVSHRYHWIQICRIPCWPGLIAG